MIGVLTSNFYSILFDIEASPSTAFLGEGLNDQLVDSRGNSPEMEQIKQQIRGMRESFLSIEAERNFMFVTAQGYDLAVKVNQMLGNGSCLFSSIYQQMYKVAENTPEFKNKVQELRENVIDFIKENIHDYTVELKDSIADMGGIKFNDLTLEHCKYYLDNVMQMASTSGGHETLKAIKEMFKTNILILKEKSTEHTFYDFDENLTKTIILAYRKLENPLSLVKYDHYDSVVDIFDTDIRRILLQIAATDDNNLEALSRKTTTGSYKQIYNSSEDDDSNRK